MSHRWAVLILVCVGVRGAAAGELPCGAIDLTTASHGDLDDGRYGRLTHFEGQWYGSSYWAATDSRRSGPDWCRVGKDWQHPGQSPSVRTFQAPRDGRVTIRGRAYKLHLAGDGVGLAIRHGDRELWRKEIGGTDQKGVEPDLQVDVRRGDRLRFIVDRRKAIACDTTFWDPVIAYADGTAYQASLGFSKKEGSGPWLYQRLVDDKLEPTGVTVRALGPDFTLRHWTLQPGNPLVLAGREVLPLVIVAQEPDQSARLLALDTAGDFTFRAAVEAGGYLRVQMAGAGAPRKLVRTCEGQWTAALAELNGLAGSMPTLHRRLAEAYQRATAGLERRPDMDLLVMLQAEWQRDDRIADSQESYAQAAREHLARAQRQGKVPGTLVRDNARCHPERSEGSGAAQNEVLRCAQDDGKVGLCDLAAAKDLGLDEWRRAYLQVRLEKRAAMLADPLLDFGKLLFVKRVPTSYSHLVMQYFGWRARAGGGLFVLERPGESLAAGDILQGKLARGNVLEPRLSYDGRRIVFSYVDCPKEAFDPAQVDHSADEGFYHVYTVDVDGRNLRQLTSGPYDDLMPAWLPDGGIVFCSTRRRGHARCFGGQFSRRWHVYTLHRMEADGSGLRILSVHDTNEWFPTITNAGLVLYSRWDYIDRDAVTHQNLWATRPDGTNPIAVWGNAALTPHCAFQAQPIPGSEKIVFTASAHHSITGGSIAVVDPKVSDNGQEAIRRITPEIIFPEAEGRDVPEYYAAPWPLSEDLFLVAYSPYPLVFEPRANRPDALGIYVLDAAGNRELLYRDPAIGSETPIPLRARPAPPVVSTAAVAKAGETGEVMLMDVRQGLGPIAPGAIRRLRIVQIFPKTTHVANTPPIGMAREENARAILGTVPVEADGSARFKVPALTPILFQALDADGMAYQTMRSLTYVQPGERVSCVGCHENRMSAPPPSGAATAMRRPASTIEPGALGGRPFSYVEVVQPVLDRQCVRCHGGEKTEGKFDLRGTPDGAFTRSYLALCGDRDFWGAGTNPENAAEALVPRFGGRNRIEVTPPGGMYGARGSRLMKILRSAPGHYGVKLTPDELERLAAWIDLNAVFYGAYDPEDQARQLRGERIEMPEIR